MGVKEYQPVDNIEPHKDKLKDDKNNKKAKRNQENECREKKPSNIIVDCSLDINKKLINESDKSLKMVREDECENDFKVTSCVHIPMSKELPVSRTKDDYSILKLPVIKPRKCCEVQLTCSNWYCPKCNKLVYSDHVKDHVVHHFMFQSSCQKSDSVQGSSTIIYFTTIPKSSFLSIDDYLSASKYIIFSLKTHLAHFKMYPFSLVYPIRVKTCKQNIININHSLFKILKELVISLFGNIQEHLKKNWLAFQLVINFYLKNLSLNNTQVLKVWCLPLKKLLRYNEGFCKVFKVLQGVDPHYTTNPNLELNDSDCCCLIKPGVNSSIEVSCSLCKITYLMIDLRRGSDLTPEITAALLFNNSLAGYSKTIENTFIPGLNAKSFYVSYLYTCLQNFTTETEPLQWKYSQLITVSNKLIILQHIVCGLDITRCQELDDFTCDVQRPLDKINTPATNANDYQSVTNSINQQQSFPPQQTFQATSGLVRAEQRIEEHQMQSSTANDDPLQIQPEGYHIPVNHLPSSQVYQNNTDKLVRTDKHAQVKHQDILQSSPAKHCPTQIQPKGNHTPVPNASVPSQVNVHIDERDGGSLLQIEKDGSSYVEADGKLSTVSGTATVQATPISGMPLAHEFMIGNVNSKLSCPVDHNSLGAQFVKGLPRETEVLPTAGPQLDALYNTNFEYEVQRSREEVRHKGNAKTTFYQHEVEQRAYNPMKIGELNSTATNPPTNDRSRLQVKPPEVKVETGKGADDFKPKPLPKRSCIVFGNKQYSLGNNLVSLPHMDQYFVKERKEIRPSHYLAKLVLRHQYQNRDDMNEETPAITAAQQSQAAVLDADSAVEKDGAVTEQKHFPMNLNRPGFVVFTSDLTRFSGSIKYPLPSKKATAVKLGKGGNGFVFAIFHNGKEYAVKKTVYRPNEIRVHSQLAHPNLVNLDAVLVGEEHERHKGKFYAFCFMTKCDLDFRSVISTKDHGCLKHLKLQLSDQRDVWQLVMVNVKYVLRSVLKALDYMHAQGLVHRDVKASNVLLKMQCNCSKPLMCACPQKYSVKLGDFDSSTTVPGHGLRIEPHQMIRYASVLPLGTMGYRAPEVSMHLVIAGPYEVLYTTAVDIWSFGCLLLNMLIGKCGPLKQRGEASLLLSTQEQPYAESLYKQIIKIKELQKYYGDMPELVDLVCKCLQVKVHCRPSAKQLLQLDILQCV